MTGVPTVPAGPAIPTRDVRAMALPDLRAHRVELAAEAARVQRWRRLLRARAELVVAGAAPADDLAGGPADACLRNLLQPRRDDDTADVLLRLDEACHALDEYAEVVAERSQAATDELVARYASDPASALVAVPRAG